MREGDALADAGVGALIGSDHNGGTGDDLRVEPTEAARPVRVLLHDSAR